MAGPVSGSDGWVCVCVCVLLSVPIQGTGQAGEPSGNPEMQLRGALAWLHATPKPWCAGGCGSAAQEGGVGLRVAAEG